ARARRARRRGAPPLRRHATAGSPRGSRRLPVRAGRGLAGRASDRARGPTAAGPRADTGASFFAGHGAATAERWRNTLRWLDSLAAGGGREERIVAAACDVFRTLDRWVERQQVPQ